MSAILLPRPSRLPALRGLAGQALAAGVDLVLVSYDPRQVYRALYGAAQALEGREIAPATLAQSRRRLAAFGSAIR